MFARKLVLLFYVLNQNFNLSENFSRTHIKLQEYPFYFHEFLDA